MWFDYLANFVSDPAKISVATVGWTLAAWALRAGRRTLDPTWKLRLLGLHVALLFFPLVFAALTWDCGMWMSECLPMLSIPLLPLAFGLLFVGGYATLPWAYRWAHRNHRIQDPELIRGVQSHSARLGIRPPDLYYLDTARPTAHTFTGPRPFVFLSVGLMDLLDRKEVEAVLLHELAHIRNRSSLRAFASCLLPWTAPALSFGESHRPEEALADQLAAELLQTEDPIRSARSKVAEALREFDRP